MASIGKVASTVLSSASGFLANPIAGGIAVALGIGAALFGRHKRKKALKIREAEERAAYIASMRRLNETSKRSFARNASYSLLSPFSDQSSG
jgi:hypothetical protein